VINNKKLARWRLMIVENDYRRLAIYGRTCQIHFSK